MQSNNPLDLVRNFIQDIGTKLINPAVQRGKVNNTGTNLGTQFQQNTQNVGRAVQTVGNKIPFVGNPISNVGQTIEQVATPQGRQDYLKGVNDRLYTGRTYKDSSGKIVHEFDTKKMADPTIFMGLSAPSELKIPKIPVSGTEAYLKELITGQKAAQAGEGIVPKFGAKVNNFLNDVKAKIVDSTAPIEDVLSQAEKKNKFNVLPKNDIRLQIDRTLRSNNLAGQFAKDNGLVDIIKGAPDLNALNQYMIAKHAGSVEELGVQTGRNLGKDKQLVQDLAPIYEPFAKQVNAYTRKLLQYSVDTGLVSQDTADALIKKYPEYVPLNRVFSDLEKESLPKVGTKAVASLSSQSVVQKLKGSTREIVNPLESILAKTSDAFSQGERNVAGRQLASYKDLPGFEGLIKEVTGNAPTHSFSYLDNGVKKVFETTPEIASAAKSLNVQQIGLLGKIFRTPTRILQLGATGLNLPFTVTNVAKDQMTAFVNSNNVARTSLLNPINFVKALFAAVGHGDLYDEVVRNAAGGTSFDIARDAPNLTVEALRAGKSLGSKIKYTVTRPSELLRAVEDIIGRGEELTRIQQYAGTKNGLLAQGRTAEDAALLGAKAARENTANFARKGEFSRVLNAVIPFFNAGIQGARQLTRSFSRAPVATTAKIGIGLFLPAAAATTWNLSDPARRQIYEDIKPYEKDNNLIIIPDGATKDSQGRYNIIKIPIPPGLSNLTRIFTRSLEASQGMDPVGFGEVASNLITAGTSIDVTDPKKLVSSFTPQAVKPFLETALNKNLYTGQDIVPTSMKNLPASAQVKDYTPPIPRAIGGILGVSPLKVQNFVSTAAGGLGNQLMGVESPVENLQRRFGKASGGTQLDNLYSAIDKYHGVEQQVKALIKSGKKDEAIKFIQDNKQTFKYGQVLKSVDSKLTKLNKIKKDISSSSNLSKSDKDSLLARVDEELKSIAFAVNKTVK
jgi:hypothetical protein